MGKHARQSLDQIDEFLNDFVNCEPTRNIGVFYLDCWYWLNVAIIY